MMKRKVRSIFREVANIIECLKETYPMMSVEHRKAVDEITEKAEWFNAFDIEEYVEKEKEKIFPSVKVFVEALENVMEEGVITPGKVIKEIYRNRKKNE